MEYELQAKLEFPWGCGGRGGEGRGGGGPNQETFHGMGIDIFIFSWYNTFSLYPPGSGCLRADNFIQQINHYPSDKVY